MKKGETKKLRVIRYTNGDILVRGTSVEAKAWHAMFEQKIEPPSGFYTIQKGRWKAINVKAGKFPYMKVDRGHGTFLGVFFRKGEV